MAKVRFSNGCAELFGQVTAILGDWRPAETYFRRTDRRDDDDSTDGALPGSGTDTDATSERAGSGRGLGRVGDARQESGRSLASRTPEELPSP